MLSMCEGLSCRRQHLLRYFGETAAKPCGNCDACLEPADTFDAMVESQKILSTIWRTGESFGAGYVTDVLRGSENAKVLSRGHEKLSCYGIGADKPKTFWNTLLRQLLSQDYIKIKNWEYKTLSLTPKSSSLLKGEQPFLMRVKKIASKSLSKRSSNEIEATHGREDLFESLRTLRLSLAKENNVPPYLIFSDKSLHDMCQLLPRNKSEFLMVNGVGQSKCERFGDDFIEEIIKIS